MQKSPYLQNYYREIEFSLWNRKINHAVASITSLKRDKSKKKYFIELYSTYLQLIEIFCINVFVITENDLWSNVFLSNRQLAEKIQNRFYQAESSRFDKKFSTFFLEHWVFGVEDKTAIRDFAGKIELYLDIIKESLFDYSEDKHFLNSYKHGFRVQAGGKSTFGIGIGTSQEVHKLGDFNASVTYFHKKEAVIFERQICFNWERIYQKTSFLLNMLQNIKTVYTAKSKQVIDINTLFIVDSQQFNQFSGYFRTNTPIFEIK